MCCWLWKMINAVWCTLLQTGRLRRSGILQWQRCKLCPQLVGKSGLLAREILSTKTECTERIRVVFCSYIIICCISQEENGCSLFDALTKQKAEI